MAELPALLHTLRDHGGMLQTQLAILLLLLTGLPGFLAMSSGCGQCVVVLRCSNQRQTEGIAFGVDVQSHHLQRVAHQRPLDLSAP